MVGIYVSHYFRFDFLLMTVSTSDVFRGYKLSGYVFFRLYVECLLLNLDVGRLVLIVTSFYGDLRSSFFILECTRFVVDVDVLQNRHNFACVGMLKVHTSGLSIKWMSSNLNSSLVSISKINVVKERMNFLSWVFCDKPWNLMWYFMLKRLAERLGINNKFFICIIFPELILKRIVPITLMGTVFTPSAREKCCILYLCGHLLSLMKFFHHIPCAETHHYLL